MRTLATIQKIESLSPIDCADEIEVARVLGWNVVVKKGQFSVGDLCLYLEVDSLLPQIEQFAFLAPRGAKPTLMEDGTTKFGYRLRTIKLRGQVSQGLVFPVMEFKDLLQIGDLAVGMDVTERLGVVKYEAPIPAELQGKRKGNFPEDIPKTDETRVQGIPKVLERNQDELFYIAEKVDGTSITIFWDHEANELHVAGRTIDWDRATANSYWINALALDFDIKGKSLGNIVLQGELIGEGIQGNKLKVKGQKILFFNAYDRSTSKYLPYSQFITFCESMGVETVPILETNFSIKGMGVDEIVALSMRRSVINKDVWVEGVVLRSMTDIQDPKIGRLSFKAINPNFLLKYEE
jgi:RNA ligase (TIGR02306 family)